MQSKQHTTASDAENSTGSPLWKEILAATPPVTLVKDIADTLQFRKERAHARERPRRESLQVFVISMCNNPLQSKCCSCYQLCSASCCVSVARTPLLCCILRDQ